MSSQDWWQHVALERQVRQVEKTQRQQAAAAHNWDWYQYQVTPTCPPSTSIYVRGGWAWDGASFGGEGWYFEGQTFDLADTAITYQEFAFTNAYWFTACTVALRYYGAPPAIAGVPLYLYGAEPDSTRGGGLEEFATAAEAEASLDASLNDAVCNYYCLPLCQLILRNNGTTDLPNQYQIIDRVNRGRSYIFGGDFRRVHRI